MIRLAAFDLDCTLAFHGEAIAEEALAMLRLLEEKGVRIVICSGKPVYYLCGMFRQAQLNDPIFIGEVGACTQFGVHLPPKVHYHLPYDKCCDLLFKELREEIGAAIPDIWFQPSEVNLSPFPKNEEEFGIIRSIIQSHPELEERANIYFYSDAVDFVPRGIDKGAALRVLAKRLHISPEEIAAVGDSPSDYPMFRFAGESYAIGTENKEKADFCVESAGAAIEKITRSVL